jgi:single-stranded-DNA-specific exonuclease
MDQLGVPEPVAAILIQRGYAEPEAAKAFLRPRLGALRDPWSMADMEVAVDRVAAAIDAGELILAHGDYDVDGVCGTSLLVRALRDLGARVEPFVPHRLRDGYDFGAAGLARAVELGSRLVLTCDCGVAAHATIAAARRAQIDVIVSDHHTPSDELPPAFAVLNPLRGDCAYPEKTLCGSGVAFKLLHALYERRGRSVEDLYRYLDLVAIPTIADLVPLSGENRVLARFGLKVLRRTPNAGLRALLQVAGLGGDAPINAGQIAFVVGPRLNAVGRMGDAMRGVRLLLSDDEAEARLLANMVEEENRVRQEVDRATLEEADARLEGTFDPESDRAIVLASPEWHSGVIGIVASRLVEKYYRPTVLIALDGDAGRGSGRSIPGFHLYEALKACEAHLEQFGGHRYAAGLRIRAERLDAFREAFHEVARARLAPEHLLPSLRIDVQMPVERVSAELWRFLAHFGPYGQGNPRPTFLARNVGLRGAPEVVGEGHLRLRLDAGQGVASDAIGFGMADLTSWLDGGSRVDIAYHLGVRSWQGVEYIQAQIIDVRPSEEAWASSES